MKKLITIVLVIIMVFAATAFANDGNNREKFDDAQGINNEVKLGNVAKFENDFKGQIESKGKLKYLSIKNKNEIAKFAQSRNISEKKAKKIKEVIIGLVSSEEVNSMKFSNKDGNSSPIMSSMWTDYYMANVVNHGDNWYYTNAIVSDWYTGPSTTEFTHSASFEVGLKLGLGIKRNDVSANVGYDVSASYTLTRSIDLVIPEFEEWNLKVYEMLRRHTWDVYAQNYYAYFLKLGDPFLVDDGYSLKPIGLGFDLIRYDADGNCYDPPNF